MEPPLVSIVWVTMNRCAELVRGIESALTQDYPVLEFVVVDNGSSDDTVAEVARRFPQVRVMSAGKNLGAAAARNLAATCSYGEWVYFLDDDGWLAPDAVRQAVARLRGLPTAAAVMSRIEFVPAAVAAASDGGVMPEVFPVRYVCGGCAVVRRELFLRVGGFPEDFFLYGEEVDLAWRWLEAGYSCQCAPASVMFHQPSTKNRNRFNYYRWTLRNALKTAFRRLPAPLALVVVVMQGVHALRFALLRRHPALPFFLAYDFCVNLPLLWRQRHPVRWATVRAFYRTPEYDTPGYYQAGR